MNDLNDELKFINNETNNLLLNVDFKYRDNIWNYLSKKKIDYINTKFNITGINEEGYISQLFNIFNNNKLFCLYKNQLAKCQLCGYESKLPWLSHTILFEITIDWLDILNIPLILNYKLSFEKREKWDTFYDKYKIDNSIIVNYSIDSFPLFLFIIFDMEFVGSYK